MNPEQSLNSPTFSFVIPIYNESETLPVLYERISSLLGKIAEPSEVILVDDGSKDRSYLLMQEIQKKDSRFKIIALSRNFGHQVAITAGMDFSVGKATVVMDADLQDPPEVILEMIECWKQGYDVVYGVRKERQKETVFKKITAALFYRFIRKISEIDIPQDTGDFRLVDRKALDAFLKLRERNRFVRGMFSWIGYKQTSVSYVRSGRFAGETKYPLRKMLKLAKDAIFGFSTVPLRLSLQIGFITSSISLLIGLWAVFLKVTGRYTITGWTSLAVMITFLGGVQLMLMGFLGEYIARIHDEIKGRPLYLIREMQGINLAQVNLLK